MSSSKDHNSGVDQAAKGGPKTAVGKARSSANAIKHGVLALRVLSDESHAHLRELATGIMEELEPVGMVEALLVERIVWTLWRLRRVARAETLLLVAPEVADGGAADVRVSWVDVGDDGESESALPALSEEQQRRRQQQAEEQALRRYATDVGVLSRYETSLERSLFKTLTELRWLQDHRQEKEGGQQKRKPGLPLAG